MEIPRENTQSPMKAPLSGGPMCGAKTRSGTPCKNPIVEGGKRCRIHGPGIATQGIASPNWKHGKYSKYMPQGIGELAHNAALDPTLYDLTELIGVYQARIQSALMAMDDGGGGAEAWQALDDAWQRFNAARQSKNAAGMFAAQDEIDKILAKSRHNIWLWKDVDVAAKNLKLLMESERKRQIEAHALIPAIKATDFAREIVLAVRSEITDQATLSRIQARVTDILGGYPQVTENV